MSESLQINTSKRCLNGLPDGWNTIFLADLTDLFGPINFIAVIYLGESPQCEDSFSPEKARVVAFQKNTSPIVIEDVVRLEKNPQGGVSAIFQRFGSTWYIRKLNGAHLFMGKIIPPERIFVSFC